MQRVIVRWGKFKLELPAEVFILLVVKAFHIAHYLSM